VTSLLAFPLHLLANRLFFFPDRVFPFFVFNLVGFVGFGSGGLLFVGAAPRTRFRPSLSVSVIIGLAVGRNLNSFEYLQY
jgi:hypothetical protein